MDIVEKIKELIQQTEKSKIYKSQLITDYYNEVFGTNEKPTNCGSCLRVKLLKLKNWVKEQEGSSSQPTPPNHLTFEEAREEITIINDALRNEIIEPDSKLSNDRLVEVIEEKITTRKKGKKKKE
ncbi:hypothetical protein [Dysgonomonas sp. 520]|uniref:hypothetical protein n=1 Tax=Dysgonomonas sp. 520 TaxID=2302931 RepID=UPI0013D65F41|nr:hypothetical protein [Dysgonomonas sp. 520]NDW10676.1 hypothetical protein [Dysgonomonas sp. 520]